MGSRIRVPSGFDPTVDVYTSASSSSSILLVIESFELSSLPSFSDVERKVTAADPMSHLK